MSFELEVVLDLELEPPPQNLARLAGSTDLLVSGSPETQQNILPQGF